MWVVLVVVMLLAVGCGASGDSGGSGTTTTAGGLTSSAPSSSGQGELGDATAAAAGEAEEVIGAPVPVTPESANAAKGGLPHCPDDGLTINEGTRARAEKSATCIVNKVRKRRGIKSLKSNSKLYSAAQKHATDMGAGAVLLPRLQGRDDGRPSNQGRRLHGKQLVRLEGGREPRLGLGQLFHRPPPCRPGSTHQATSATS